MVMLPLCLYKISINRLCFLKPNSKNVSCYVKLFMSIIWPIAQQFICMLFVIFVCSLFKLNEMNFPELLISRMLAFLLFLFCFLFHLELAHFSLYTTKRKKLFLSQNFCVTSLVRLYAQITRQH